MWTLSGENVPLDGKVLCPICKGSGYGMVMKDCTFTRCTFNGSKPVDRHLDFAAFPCATCNGDGWVATPAAASGTQPGETP